MCKQLTKVDHIAQKLLDSNRCCHIYLQELKKKLFVTTEVWFLIFVRAYQQILDIENDF